jgi:hypothetical protein
MAVQWLHFRGENISLIADGLNQYRFMIPQTVAEPADSDINRSG